MKRSKYNTQNRLVLYETAQPHLMPTLAVTSKPSPLASLPYPITKSIANSSSSTKSPSI